MSNGLPKRPRVAVAGATGAVGRVMLELIARRNFPAAEVVALASARSAGQTVPSGDSVVEVSEISPQSLEGIHLALFDTPDDVARRWVPAAVEAGAIVIDNSAAWRMENDVPLVVPEINPHAVLDHHGIIASPNCTTITVVVPLYALHRVFGLRSAVISSYQAVSGVGRAGVEELREQAEKIAGDIDPLAAGRWDGSDPSIFPGPIAFNVLPRVGEEDENGFTGEELKLLHESRKILELPGLEITSTCARVPSVAGHGASVLATFEKSVDRERTREVLSAAPGVELADLPTPLASAGGERCLVGRIRQHPFDPRSIWFFVAADNLRKGAALNTLQIAELLLH